MSDINPDSNPPPRRRRWGRRMLIALALLPVLLVLLHGLWIFTGGRGLATRVAALRAAGEPMLPADFAPPTLSPDQNGGPDIDAAGAAMEQYARTTGKTLSDMDLALPLRPEERQAIEQALNDVAPALAQFEQGRRKPRHEPTLNLTSPVLINIVLGRLNGTRALANLLAADALLQHEKGDDAAAMRRIDDVVFVSRYTDKNPSLVGHLVSIGCLALATQQAFEIAPDFRIGTKPGDAAPADVRKMIDQLLDDVPPREGLRLALRGERMGQLDTMDAFSRGVAIPLGGPGAPPVVYRPVGRYLSRPMFNHNARAMLEHMTALLPCVDQPDLPTMLENLPPKQKSVNPFNAMAQILVPALGRAIETHHRVTSDRRLAATAIAIRWYQLDHNGQVPAKLQELVPKYLPAVPKDSLLRDQVLGYLPDTNRPRLYSAGENNRDDGGSDAFIRPYPDGRRAERGDEWRTLDRCVSLDRPPRPAPNPPPGTDDSPAAP